MSSSTNPAVLVALAQLKLVDSVIGAMRAADKAAAKTKPPVEQGGGSCGANGCTPADCSPRYAARPVLHPEPRYLPRPVIHPSPFYAPAPPTPCEPCPDKPSSIEAGPQAPWKILPWQEPAKIPAKIKVVIRQPDMLRRGTLIDFFC